MRRGRRLSQSYPVEVKTEDDAHALKKSLQAIDREVPEVSMVSLPATGTSPSSTEKEIVSVGKPEAFEKEAERGAASAKEKEKPTAVFSAKLNVSSCNLCTLSCSSLISITFSYT